MSPPAALVAASLAAAAMSSVVIGAGLGLYLRPSERLIAQVLGFGAGALINALAIDLAYKSAHHLVQATGVVGPVAWLVVASGFAGGGFAYLRGARYIDQRGGAARSSHRARKFLLAQKRVEAEAVLARLARVDFLRALPAEEMESLVPCVVSVNVPAGVVVFLQGEQGDALYLIDDGQVEILDPERGAGHERVAVLGPGAAFGEIALLSGEPRTATARAATDAVLLRISRSDFETLLEQSPTLRQAVHDMQHERVLSNVRSTTSEADARRWQRVASESFRKIGRSEVEHLLVQKNVTSPLAIWLGNVLDTVPGSIVIGAGYTTLAAVQPTFLVAVFVANLPEAMASAHTMRAAGYATARIFGLWSALIALGALLAGLGNLLLPSAPPVMMALAEATAGGAILALVAKVMVPHAYEEGGESVALWTIAGFLTSFLLTTLELH